MATKLTDLQGYPMVMAVSEHAINKQLQAVQSDLPTSWHLPEDPAKEEGEWTLVVDEFEAPQVDFNSSTVNGCRLKLKVKRGQFTTVKIVGLKFKMEGRNLVITDPGKPVPVVTSLDGVTFYADTQVSKIRHEEFSDEDFEVQQLYADLEKVSLVTIDLSQDLVVQLAAEGEVKLKGIIQQKLEDIAKSAPDSLVFGYVKIPKIAKVQQDIGPLAPKACTYSTYKHVDGGGNYLNGSLNYLLSLDGNLLTGAASGTFNSDWVQPGYDATLVISDYILLKEFLIPGLQKIYPGGKDAQGKQTSNPMMFHLQHGNSETGEAAVATMAEPFNFQLPNGHDATYTSMVCKIKDGAVRVDYVFTYQKKNMAMKDTYKATGYMQVDVTYASGKMKATVTRPEPTVTKLDNGFWHDFADGLGIGFTFGLLYILYDKQIDDGYDLGQDITDAFQTGIPAMPNLFELPGRAVFTFANGKVDSQFKINCGYAAGPAT